MRVSPEIESLIPYKPGKPIEETKREYNLNEVIKLASNENPLGTSPKALDAIKKEINNLSRYPDPSCYELKNVLSENWGFSHEEMVIGNGSNELIDLLIRVFCEPGDKVLMPSTSFIAYSVCSQAARVGKKEFALQDDFQVDVDGIIDYVNKDLNSRDKIFFLANPNNPTGSYTDERAMEKLMAAFGGRDDILFVFDEAYNEFVRADDYPDSFSYAKKYKNVMVMRTFSKVYGLAGLRVGALVGAPEHLQWVNRVRNPFNVNSLAQAAAAAAIKDTKYIENSQKRVWKGLDRFYEFFESKGLPYTRSQANFVLFDSLRDGNKMFQNMMEKGLLVRPMGPYKLPTHLRLSIGLEIENTRAIEIMEQALDEVEVIRS